MPRELGRRLHIILKLASGTWLVSDQADDATKDWREREFNFADIHWRRLDIEKVTEGFTGRNEHLIREKRETNAFFSAGAAQPNAFLVHLLCLIRQRCVPSTRVGSSRHGYPGR
jgi:hypothetical protein